MPLLNADRARQVNVPELGGSRERDVRAPGLECALEMGVGMTMARHGEGMFPHPPVKLTGTMTVCLAVLCEDGRTVVVAADRMVTFGGIIEFKHTVPTIAPATSRAMVMIAGDTLLGTELAQAVATQLEGTTPSIINTIAVALGQTFQAIRQREMESPDLGPLCSRSQLVLRDTSIRSRTRTKSGATTSSGTGRSARGAIHALQSMIGFRHDATARIGEVSRRRREIPYGDLKWRRESGAIPT